MRALLVLIVAVVGLGFRASGPADFSSARQADDEDAGDDAKPDVQRPNYKGPKCIQAEAYARYGAGAYDHIVKLDSSCTKLAHCEVSTDVNPEPIEVDVPDGETREVVTFRGSPAYEFSATVRCKLE